MASESFKDAAGATKYRKTTGAGTSGDPAVCHNIIDSGTISLPSGAATDTKQDTIITALQLIDDVVFAEDAAHGSGDKGVMTLAVRSDAGGAIAGTDGDYSPLQVDASGALRVTGGGGGTEYTEDAAAAANPVGGASILVRSDTPSTITGTDGDNVAQRGTNYGAAYVQLVTSAGAYIDSVGGGTQYAVDAALGSTPTGTLAVAIRDDSLSTLTPVEGDAIGLRVDANGALWTTVSGTVTVGTHAVTQSGTWNVTVNAALPAGTNNIGDVDVLSLPALAAGTNAVGDVGIIGRTSGGLTLSRTLSAASTNATSVKASAGQVFWIYATNTNAAARFLKLYNKSSAPTVGSDTPVLTLLIPGNAAGAGFHLQTPLGLTFGTGIAFALTTGIADADTAAVAANEIVVNMGYK
jgi:hypothetical protein